jgi:hypothetical protein
MALDLFISYSHADRELRDELAKHLSGLRNLGIINDWFDGDIIEGTEWEQELLHHLNTAQIILLLVSANFIASEFSYQIEMQRALERHDAGLARVIPIILHPTDWKQLPFAKIQALPTDGKPVSVWPNRNEAFVNIVKGIKRSIRNLQDIGSSAADKTEGENIHVDADQHKAKAPGQSKRVQRSPVRSGSTNNSIGSIGGEHNQVYQADTVNSTVTNYYRRPSPDARSKGASGDNAKEEERHGTK